MRLLLLIVLWSVAFAATTAPAKVPTLAPTNAATSFPTKVPTRKPTPKPSRCPTSRPTSHPSARPTSRPTSHPTARPTSRPTSHPTRNPSHRPTAHSSRPSISSDHSSCSSSYSDYSCSECVDKAGSRSWCTSGDYCFATGNVQCEQVCANKYVLADEDSICSKSNGEHQSIVLPIVAGALGGALFIVLSYLAYQRLKKFDRTRVPLTEPGIVKNPLTETIRMELAIPVEESMEMKSLQ